MSAPDRLGRNRSYRATMDRDDAHGNGGASVATGARTAAGARTTAPAAGRRSAATTASKVVVGSKAGAAASNARLLSNQAAMNVSRKKITATLPTSTHTTAVDDLMDLDRPGSKQRAGAARASVTRGPVQRAAASTTRLNVTRPQHADALDVLLAAEKAASTAAGAVAAQPSPLPSPAPSRTNSLVSALPDAINGKDPGGVAAADAAEELADAARVGPSGVAVPVAITGVHRVRGGRPYMEDRHTVVEGLSSVTSAMLTRQGQQEPSRTYVAVFDGHNGADCAEIAARDVHRYLSCHAGFNMEPPSPEVDFRAAEAAAQRAPESPYHRDGKVAAFKDAFRQVDEDIIQKCNSGVARGGSTALALLRENNLLYAAHAGDSRAVLGRNGKALRLTVDHKPNLPRERRRIVDNGGMVELVGCWRVIIATPGEGRVLSGLAVSRSLGDVEFKQPTKLVTEEPDVSRLRLTPNDNMVIAASDGLWDVMSDQDAVELATRTVRGWLRQRDRSSPAASPSQRGLVRRTSRSGQSPSALSSTAARLGLSRSSSKVLSPGSEPSTPKTGPGWGAERVPQAAAEAAAKALCERALREGSMDNITCVVMLLQWP
ncbi:unnamed protein product [Pedinophyceae sp. YPF-701]|nr:unnamed protein product [Pedinophyceae sp. YPF-701]